MVVLCKDNAHRVDTLTKTTTAAVKTYHEFFRLGAGDPSMWDPSQCDSVASPDVVVWDEVGCVPSCFLGPAVDWCMRRGATVYLCGDEHQLRPIGNGRKDAGPVEVARELLARYWGVERRFETDYRAASCASLQELKKIVHGASNTEALRQLTECCHERGRGATLEEAVSAWKPSDVIAVSTNAQRKKINALVRTAAEEKNYETVYLRFSPAIRAPWRKKNGVLPLVPTPDGNKVPAVVNSVVPCKNWREADPSLWELDAASTVSSLQGRTVEQPAKLYIVAARLAESWQEGSVYTALSRARALEQVVLVV